MLFASGKTVKLIPRHEPHRHALFASPGDHCLEPLVRSLLRHLDMVERAAARAQSLFDGVDSEENFHL